MIFTKTKQTQDVETVDVALPRYSQHGGLDHGEIHMKLEERGGRLWLLSIELPDDGRSVTLEISEVVPALGPNGDYYLGLGRHTSSEAAWLGAVKAARVVARRFFAGLD